MFTDHFLSTPFDLSNVVFIATANTLETIHPALLDRMEIVDISGYSLQEKLEIAKRYLIPKQIKENGITADHIEFMDP
jgi:ATP-dependent Lon protease